MTAPSHLHVVGGGVMGLGIAWRLASRGLRVTLYERDRCGGGASNAAAGMLAPLAELEPDEDALRCFALASQHRWPTLARELRDATGIDVELDTTGTLIVALEPDDVARLQPLIRQHRELGLDSRWMSAEEARKTEPLLSPQVVGALYCPQDVQVSNRRLVEALRVAAEAAGVTLIEGSHVQEIGIRDGQVRSLTLREGAADSVPRTLPCDAVLLCAGAWSRSLDGLGELRPPVRPVRGQMIALRSLPEAPLPLHVLRGPEAYLVPKRDGRLVIGATSEEKGFEAGLTAGGMLQLLRGAWEMLPLVWEMPVIETWSGFRPGSRDNAPLLGAAGAEGLWMATGHYRNGIQQAPLTIESVANAILDGRLPAIAAPFRADRFLRRR